MTRRTRRSVLAALGVGLATAGCLSDAGTGTGDETTANETTDRPAGETPVRETTDGWVSQASNSPEPDHEVSVRSEASTSRTLRVEVVREATGEPVFETTRTVSPGGEIVLYNLRRADPDGVESFRICGRVVEGGGTESRAGTAETGSAETETARTTTRRETTQVSTARTTADTDQTGATGTAGATRTVRTETASATSTRRDCATISTDECHGGAVVTVSEGGSVQVIYAVC